MQSNEKPASNGTGEPMPPLGPNKIAQAMDDYDQMASELLRTKAELLEQIDLGRRLLAENEAVRNQMQVQTEFLTRQVDIANTRAHILGATMTALRTNYATVREILTRCETEALSVGVEAAKTPPEAEKMPVLGPVPGDEVPSSISAEDHQPLGEMTELEKYAPKRSPASYQT